MRVQFYNAIADIGKALWDNFDHKSYPFSQYTFLEALERSDENHGGACCTESGWQPHHLVIFDKDDVAIAGLPLYVKYHSFGEYIFDWAWADAYQRHGIEYYPKLLSRYPIHTLHRATIANQAWCRSRSCVGICVGRNRNRTTTAGPKLFAYFIYGAANG